MFIQNRLGLIECTETMLAQSQRLNQVTNNLANVDTSGYKREDLTFWEMLYTTNEDRQRVGKAIRLTTDHEQGAAVETGNQLDFAISGKGFFKIQTPDGVAFTRSGQFHPNHQGQLITPAGHLVLGKGGPIVINGNHVSVSEKGNIQVDGQTMDQFQIVQFADPDQLAKKGENLFQAEGNIQEEEAGDFSLKQGFLEGSNVNTISEMTVMLELHRAYQTQQRIIRTFDDMDNKAINNVGKLT